MLENKPAWQDRQGVALDGFRIDRNHRDAEKVSNDAQETMFVDFAGIEHLRRPRTAIHILGKVGLFLARLHAAREQ